MASNSGHGKGPNQPARQGSRERILAGGVSRGGTSDPQLADYGTATVKPNSITRWALDGSSLLKVYRGIAPHERRRREADALKIAAEWGLSVPPVLATGESESHVWTVFGAVPGRPCSIRTTSGVLDYVRHVITATHQLHREVGGVPPGSGWRWFQSDALGNNRGFLLDQFSARCPQLVWWPDLEAALKPCNELPTVYLHCDLKPEHLLFDGDQLHIVDWEASGRGPAVSDHADAVFHLIRDLIYTSVAPRRLPIGVISQVRVSGAVLAWRLALWLDRRRSGDIQLVPAHDLYQLAAEDDPAAACGQLARTISHLRAAGVPR
ncbi:aminoglycoside phosphotransferase family protein [Streptomyces sp. NBC_01236]|uniref:aminoglycoside phosphotransferase family protein n=1 Tax=Streptomyces sp. NBC_01236 TaxID=2903789 RepID=UPI002E154A90|nr:aminoglycoside phosphotransferase family protein [Streptomyces sp. NBC_01236]